MTVLFAVMIGYGCIESRRSDAKRALFEKDQESKAVRNSLSASEWKASIDGSKLILDGIVVNNMSEVIEAFEANVIIVDKLGNFVGEGKLRYQDSIGPKARGRVSVEILSPSLVGLKVSQLSILTRIKRVALANNKIIEATDPEP